MRNKEVITETRQVLEDFYQNAPTGAVLSMFLWGSVLTEDFDAKRSDIDTIAIVSDEISYSEEEIRTSLQSRHSFHERLGFRFLYKSELDGGRRKSALAKRAIHPEVLLLDMKFWRLVAGEDITSDFFKLETPTLEEAVELRKGRFRRDDWMDVVDIPKKERKYLLGHIARIVHLIVQQRQGEEFPFSYSDVISKSSGANRKVIEAIIDVKEKQYDNSTFLAHSALLQDFVDKLFTD